jgi:hypothetical protein
MTNLDELKHEFQGNKFGRRCCHCGDWEGSGYLCSKLVIKAIESAQSTASLMCREMVKVSNDKVDIEAENEALRNMLRSFEWSDVEMRGYSEVYSCPRCNEDELNGHADDCEMADLLRIANE